MPKPSEDVIRSELARLRNVYDEASAKYRSHESLQDQVMDPLTSCLHCAFGEMSFEEFLGLERARRIDKSMTNAIGQFHENVLASIPGWHHPKSGVDLICEEMKIAAEVKNKHNTANSGAARKIHDDLETFLRQREDYTAYFVTIIPKNGKTNEPWSVSGKSTNKNIRVVDGVTFYDMATGEEGMLLWVYDRICEILKADDSLRDTISKLLGDAYRGGWKSAE